MIGGLPERLVGALAADLGLDVAVETGTYRCDSTAKLSRIFTKVWTIEADEQLYRDAVRLYAEKPSVTIVHGRSEAHLPEVVRQAQGPALFWLDAHWFTEVPVDGLPQCPVLSEITAIDSCDWSAASCIVIDDARLFVYGLREPYREQEWPALFEIVDLLRLRFFRHVAVVEDVIVAGPPRIRDTIRKHRLSSPTFRHRSAGAEAPVPGPS